MGLLLNADLSTGDRSQLGGVEYGGTFDGTPPLSERVLVAPEIDGVKPVQGGYLMRLRCAPGDQYSPTEASGWRTLIRLEEPIRVRPRGTDTTITYMVLVKPGWPGDANIWIAGLEWHNAGGQGTPAPHHVMVYRDRMHADLWWGAGPSSQPRFRRDYDFAQGYEQGRWQVVTVRVRQDDEPNGVLQIWHGQVGVDATMANVVDVSGVGSVYGDTNGNYGMFGVYRDQSGQAVNDLYFGGLREYSTAEEALAWGNSILAGAPTPPTPPTPPPPPTVVKPTVPAGLTAAPGDRQVVLSWAANPAADNVDAYQVYLDDNTLDLRVTDTTYTVTGLENGRAYTLRVSAHNQAGYGDWTPPVTVTPAAPAPPPPEPGLPLTVVGTPGKTVTLSWKPVPCEGYLFLRDGVRVSRTFDPARDKVRFDYSATSVYEVVAVDLRELTRGRWPAG